jgi:hypothetical protein
MGAGRSGDRISVGGEIFRTCPDRPWAPPSFLYNGYRVFPEGKKRLGRDADPSPPSSAVGNKRVELYLYSPYGLYGLYRASVPVQGQPLPLFYHNVDEKMIIFCSVVPIIFLNEVGNPGSQWSYNKTVKPTLLQRRYNRVYLQ